MKSLPSTLYKGKKLVYTSDSSITFYSLDYNEAYRAKSIGAFTESLHKFVRASRVEDLIREKDVLLLDMFLGAGYNLAVLLYYILKIPQRKRLFIVSIEKDASLLEIIKKSYFLWPYEGFDLLRKLITQKKHENIYLELYIQDICDFIKNCNLTFDIIFFDPFSSKNNPGLWYYNMYRILYSLLNVRGKVVTYASSKKIIEDFEKAGFKAFSMPKIDGSFSESSIFVKA
ncbi:MAG: MnmC family methyltransferase [Deferribacterota bacterium]|nr:MnmC family methyltransferase [Deferribacterota bacterium]